MIHSSEGRLIPPTSQLSHERFTRSIEHLFGTFTEYNISMSLLQLSPRSCCEYPSQLCRASALIHKQGIKGND